MDLGYYSRRRKRSSDPRAALKVGLGLVLTLTILCLLLYCSPGSKYAARHMIEDSEANEAQHTFTKASVLLDGLTDTSIVLNAFQNRTDEDANKKKSNKARMQEASILMGGYLTDKAEGGSDPQDTEPDAAAALRRKVSQLSPGQCLQGICRNGTVTKSDFLFAVATHKLNEATLIAGRSGRMDIRTYVSTNYTESDGQKYPKVDSETWGYYPDDVSLRSFYEGDTRAALVPFLAYRDLGPSFKWLFYGDDDTILFLDAAMNMVKDLDPEMPYFITDHLWYSNWNYGYQWHPHWRAPRCLLCNSDVDVSSLRMKMAKACPCTPRDFCDLEGGYDNVLDKRKCGIPRSPTLTYSMHGGAGALISVGLLKKVSLEYMEDCVLSEWSTGGDALITICLWKAGYAMTDPGPLWHEDGLTHFDPSPRKLMLDQTSMVIPRAAYILGNMISKAAGVCTGLCQSEMDNVVSMHLRSRLLTNSSEGAAVFLRGVTRYYGQLKGKLQLDGSTDPASSLHDIFEEREASFAKKIDLKFQNATARLQDLIPHFKVMEEAKIRWPVEGGASAFIPKYRLQEAENGSVVLSFNDILKGSSAGVARELMEEILTETLQIYPPKPRKSLWP